MPHPETIQNLFANYAAAVGHHLPLRGRKDIRRELEGTLADRLDDRMGESGRPATLEDAYALLKETGHPIKTAASYYAHHHLIGPELYPFFVMVVRIALPVLAAVLLAVLILTAALRPEQPLSAPRVLPGILGNTAQAVLSAFGVIVLVFMVIERLDPARRAAADLDPFQPWDPRELSLDRPKKELKSSDQVGELIGNLFAMVMLLFLPSLLARIFALIGLPPQVAVLSPAFLSLIPLLLAVSGAEMLLAVFLLTRRVHTMPTVTATVVVKLFSVIVSGILLAAWTFVLPGAPATAQAIEGVRIANLVLRILCGVAIVGGCIEAAKVVIRYLRGDEGEKKR